MIGKRFLCIISVCLIANHLCASITVKSSVNKETISINDTFEYKISISGSSENLAINEGFLTNFHIIRRSSSQSYQLINNQFSSSQVKTYILRAKKEGKITIPPAKITANGNTFSTTAIQIHVKPETLQTQTNTIKSPSKKIIPNAQTSQKSKDLFITSNTNKKQAYVGEEIIYTTHLFRRLASIDKLLFHEPKLTAISEPLTRDKKTYTQAYQGRNYYVQEVDKRSLFSYQPGTLTIPASKADIQISYFYGTQSTESNAINLKILPLPTENKPTNFSGLVGEYTLTIDADTTTVIENKPLAIRLKVSGSGNLKQISDLIIHSSDTFKVYKSAVNDQITYQNTVEGSRNFEYIIVPRKAGDHSLPYFELNYFSPKSKTYKSIKTKATKISIISSGDIKSSLEKSNMETQQLQQDFRYIKENLYLNKKLNAFYQQWLALILMLVNISLATFIIFEKLRNVSLIKKWIAALKLKPNKIAINELKKLLKSQNPDTSKIKAILATYVTSIIKRPAQALPIYEIKDLLKKENISNKNIKNYESLHETCDQLAYSSTENPEYSTKEICNAALIWIEKMNKDLK